MSHIKSRTSSRYALLSAALLATLAAGNLRAEPAAAEAPVCKGQAQELCEAREDCRWVKGYTRKDGIEVAGHCRVSGKKKEAGGNGSPAPAVPSAPAAPSAAPAVPAAPTAAPGAG